MAIQQQTGGSALVGRLAPPKRYGVFLLNDDYTTMDFVVQILMQVFGLPSGQAAAVMLLVHHEGRGLCGVYSRDVALTKKHQVASRAADAGFPLKCVVEEMS
ncbi:ATP-dependent Clp protease adaptor ClpS [Neisseria leonii]|uniref:ATP-dependent Clp protease adapter protein ClpS n=1 Tax=Neisseria leonii TaxID=2995413 RepID=A0A9X4IDG2_9NEIS|nr:ATP-dependent Clp protease adaptor ClpS [Neisseria sp. 51.81]MDD9327656.1 ATP-dependent Clp protease adaptor ClpS [Neisseria sp. 51.81]